MRRSRAGRWRHRPGRSRSRGRAPRLGRCPPGCVARSRAPSERARPAPPCPRGPVVPPRATPAGRALRPGWGTRSASRLSLCQETRSVRDMLPMGWHGRRPHARRMTTAIEEYPTGAADVTASRAADHLWMHFARQGRHPETPVPVVTRGEGAYIWDNRGRKILDGLSGLFVVQVGHGRRDLAEVAAKQAAELAFFPVWGYTTPVQAELAERVAGLAPGDLNRVFFTTGGGEAVESAWKAAKQYFKLIGKPFKHKVISRAIAYHGTPTAPCPSPGCPHMKKDFEPWCPGGFRVPNTNFYRAPELRRRPQGVRPVGRRPDRGGDPVRGTGHGRRGVPRAGAELRRLLPPAARLLRAGPRDLRPARRAARLRRGDLRLRPARRRRSPASSSATSPTSSPAPRV